MTSKPHTCGCGQANPTQVLKAEHRVIERVLDALERFLAQTPLDAPRVRLALDFLREFADGCHHAKEEEALFPRLEAAGVPREGGPIACMLDDHERGRGLIGYMADHVDKAAAGNLAAVGLLRAAAGQYIDMLRKHIWKEDNVLFELADRVLKGCERGAVLRGFEQKEQSHGNADKHELYLRIASDLERESLLLSQPVATGAQQ